MTGLEIRDANRGILITDMNILRAQMMLRRRERGQPRRELRLDLLDAVEHEDGVRVVGAGVAREDAVEHVEGPAVDRERIESCGLADGFDRVQVCGLRGGEGEGELETAHWAWGQFGTAGWRGGRATWSAGTARTARPFAGSAEDGGFGIGGGGVRCVDCLREGRDQRGAEEGCAAEKEAETHG
jgi:hypothetical protein